jgi:hypothetical protein
MHDINVILADRPGLGCVRMCECNSIHLSIGPVTINLEPTAFRQMATLMSAAMNQLAEIQDSRKNERENVRMFRPPQSRMTH